MRPRRSRTRRPAIAEDWGSIHGGRSFCPSSVAPPLTAAALGQDRVLGVAQKRKRQAVQPVRSAREASGFHASPENISRDGKPAQKHTAGKMVEQFLLRLARED